MSRKRYTPVLVTHITKDYGDELCRENYYAVKVELWNDRMGRWEFLPKMAINGGAEDAQRIAAYLAGDKHELVTEVGKLITSCDINPHGFI